MKKIFCLLGALVLIPSCALEDAVSLCGNGKLDDGEECDGKYKIADFCEPGFDIVEFTCSQQCKLIQRDCTPVDPVCGNGVLEKGEECDGDKKIDDFCGPGYENEEYSCSQTCKLNQNDCKLKKGYESIVSGIAECKSSINYNAESGNIEAMLEINKAKFAAEHSFEACMECISKVDVSNITNNNNFALNPSQGCGGPILTTDGDGKVTITQGRGRYSKPGEYHCFIYVRGMNEKPDQEDEEHNTYYCGENMTIPRIVNDALMDYILSGNSQGLFQYEFTVE